MNFQDSQPDALNQTATSAAIDLINGNGGSCYRAGIKQLFKGTPALINDVDPKHREALSQILQRPED
jgi:hypothetical protein